ncbi:MAG TPA: hypothetical protein VFL59_05955, partial [Candidatus Nanopelagicales bacterium]|nr:hypothetical protein [Candidatus Nanopelagicales bacterium]
RWSSVTPRGRDRCLVTMDADILDWPALAMGMVGAPFTVLSPDAFKAHLADWATRFSAAT